MTEPTIPNTEVVRETYIGEPPYFLYEYTEEEFDRWYAAEIAAAEKRGAIKAFRKTQEIIAGFDHTIDEARERGDMINTGHLIQEIDTEIQDLMEGYDGES